MVLVWLTTLINDIKEDFYANLRTNGSRVKCPWPRPHPIIPRLLPARVDKLDLTGAGTPEVGMVRRWGRCSCPARSRKPSEQPDRREERSRRGQERFLTARQTENTEERRVRTWHFLVSSFLRFHFCVSTACVPWNWKIIDTDATLFRFNLLGVFPTFSTLYGLIVLYNVWGSQPLKVPLTFGTLENDLATLYRFLRLDKNVFLS